MQMGNWVESQPKEPRKRQSERERGGCGELAEGACLPVMRHEIDLHTWNNLKALTCCAPNWTFFGPQQPATAKRYTHTHTQKVRYRYRCSYKWVCLRLSRGPTCASVVCLMVDLLDLDLSLSLWSPICLCDLFGAHMFDPKLFVFSSPLLPLPLSR